MTNTPDKKPTLKISRDPRITEVYWCELPETEYPKEFGFDKKRRPVIIFSKKNKIYGTVLVIPLSTAEQNLPEWSVKMKSSLMVKTRGPFART